MFGLLSLIPSIALGEKEDARVQSLRRWGHGPSLRKMGLRCVVGYTGSPDVSQNVDTNCTASLKVKVRHEAIPLPECVVPARKDVSCYLQERQLVTLDNWRDKNL